MTLEDFYDQLSPIVEEFANSVDEEDETEIHAAKALFCFAMHVLQRAVEDDQPQPLKDLSLLVGTKMLSQ